MRIGKTLLIAIAGGAVLVACGDDDPTPVTVSSGKGGGADLLRATYDAQREAGSFKLDMAASFNIGGEEQPMFDGTGAAEIVDDTINEQIEMTIAGAEDEEATTMEIIMLDEVIYTDLLSAMDAPTDAEWVSIDPNDSDPISKMFGQFLEEQAGIAESTEKLIENADALTVKEGETDTIDGVDVTEYLVTVEKEDFDKLGVTGGEDIPMDELTYSLWLDEDYLPRRMTMDMGEEAGGMEMELNFTDFGGDVTIEAPDGVVSITEVIDEMLKSGELTEEDFAELDKMFSA